MQHSDEVLKAAADKVGVKALAAELKVSAALVYRPFTAVIRRCGGCRHHHTYPGRTARPRLR